MIQVVTRKSTKVVRRTELKANLKSMSGTGSTGSVITYVIIETHQKSRDPTTYLKFSDFPYIMRGRYVLACAGDIGM